MRGLGGADAAGRALPAGLVLEEAHEVQGGIARLVGLREHDHRRGADEAAVRLERVEVERDVAHRCGQDPARGAAGEIRVELVAILHPAAVFVDQLLHRDAGGRQVHAGLLHAPRHRERAQALAPVAPVLREPFGAVLEQVAHPVQRLHVVLERGPAEEAHLRDVRGTQPRHAALALDRLDHRRLFAADVGARAAAQVDARKFARRPGLQRRHFALEEMPARMVFVAQVDVDIVDAHGPRGDEHAFEEAVRVALEVVAGRC